MIIFSCSQMPCKMNICGNGVGSTARLAVLWLHVKVGGEGGKEDLFKEGTETVEGWAEKWEHY